MVESITPSDMERTVLRTTMIARARWRDPGITSGQNVGRPTCAERSVIPTISDNSPDCNTLRISECQTVFRGPKVPWRKNLDVGHTSTSTYALTSLRKPHFSILNCRFMA